jgi:hypothetical protein
MIDVFTTDSDVLTTITKTVAEEFDREVLKALVTFNKSILKVMLVVIHKLTFSKDELL